MTRPRLLLLLLATACTTTRIAPPWATPAPGPRPVGRYLGEAGPAASPPDAISTAVGRALADFTRELGVEIRAETIDVQTLEGGIDSQRIEATVRTRGIPVVVRDVKVLRKSTSAEAGGVYAWVEVQIPPGERARLKRIAAGRTWLGVRCDLEGATCPQGLAAGVRASTSASGLLFAEADIAGPKTCAEARAAGAAWWLRVMVESRFVAEQQGEFYARSVVKLDWIDTADEKVLVSASQGPIKGGHYSREAAVADAARRAVDALGEDLRLGRVSFGVR